MDEQQISAKERLKQLAEERKSLRNQLKKEQAQGKEKRKAEKELRDSALKINSSKINLIKNEIFNYNKLNKSEKSKSRILEKIAEIVN